MNSFEFFECVLSENDTCLKSKTLTPSTIEEFFKCANEKIAVYSGELSVFNNSELAEHLGGILENKPDIEIHVICGDTIVGLEGDSGKVSNPFLALLKNRDSSKTKIYYNGNSLIEQIADGYIHSLVIDGGKKVSIEKPHSYRTLQNNGENEPLTLFFDEDYDLGLELFERHNSYINFNRLPCNEYDLLDKNTFDEAEFCSRTKDSGLKNQDDYMRLRLEQVSDRIKSNDIKIKMDNLEL